MRSVILIAMLVASPVAACDMEGMFGYNHYSAVAADQAAADAMRDAAVAQARDNFMARHGIVQVADAAPTDAGPAQIASADQSVVTSDSPRQ